MNNFSTAVHILAMTLLTTSPLQAEEFSDPDYGFRFTVDDQKWKPVPIPVATLGEPVAVLTNGPQERALAVVFVRSQEQSEPVSEARLNSLSEKMARVAGAVSGATIVTNEVEQIAGRKAVSFRMTGPGTGMALGAGGTPTTQHWLAFPRAQDLIVFQVTAADDKFDAAYQDLRSMAESATFEDTRPQRQQPTFNDNGIGLNVSYPPSPWIRGGYELGGLLVPGYSLRIWSAPSTTGTSDDGISGYANRLMMFMQFPGRAYTPQELLDVSIPGLTQSGAQVVEQEIREIDGKKAMWLVVEGKSKTGSNLTGNGNVATRQLWIGIPRIHNGNHNIVVFLMNTPAADYETRLQEFQAMLKTLKIQAD